MSAISARADITKGLAAYKSGDFVTAMQEFRTAAEAGDATAMFSLGFMYLRGEGVAIDHKEAVHWLQLAAEQGLAPAQHSLALAYYEGRGVKRNTAVAANYFESAALQGLADAQYNLGVLYSRGDGVPQDYIRARFWHEKAAEQGVTDSQMALGVMYANGEGVEKNYAEAGRWFGMAATAGNKRAQRTLETAFGDIPQASAPPGASQSTGSKAVISKAIAPPSVTEMGAAGSAPPSAPPAPAAARVSAPTRKGSFWRNPPSELSTADFQELQARAVTGDAEGQLELALHYYHGVSVKRNLLRAYVWAKRAALKGNAAGESMSKGMYWELDEQLKDLAERLLKQ